MEITHNIVNFFAGDSFTWNISHLDYKPVDGYSCKVILLNSQTRIEYTLNGDNQLGTYSVSKTNTESDEIIPAKYKLYIVFIKNADGFVKQYDNGTLTVKENALTSSTIETRTQNQIQLDTVRDLISGRLVDGVNSFTVAGRSVTLMSMTELLALEKSLSSKVDDELKLSDLKNKGRTNRNKLKIRYMGFNK